MEYKFLPEAVKNSLNLHGGTEADFVLRGSGGIGGHSGESYVIFVDGNIFLFERDFASTEFRMIQQEAQAPGMKAELCKDKFSSMLNIGGYEIKLSNFESATATMLVEKINEAQRRGLQNAEIVPTPYLLLLLMLIDLAIRSDDDKKLSSPSESFIVNEICSGNRKLYMTARSLHEHGRLEEVFQALTLDGSQKRCMLANMLEMVMRDGEFSSTEQKLIHEAAAKLQIGKDDFNMIWDVILDKNCLSILTEG